MSNKILVRLMSKAAITLGVCVIIAGCCDIRTPLLVDDRQRKIAADAAAELKKWQAEGKLKGDFESIIKIQYDKLDDANTTLFLFLQAVRCESQYGNQDLAKEILIFAREEFRRRQNVKTDIAPSSSQLAPAELNEINKSDLSSEILKVFGDIGTSIESHQRIAGDEDN